MKIKHEIKNINKEQTIILKIEINFNEEFSLEFLKNNKDSGITKIIKKYVKENFKDKLYKNILIVINGITIGLFSLATILGIKDIKLEEKNINNNFSYSIKENINIDDINIPLGNLKEEEKKEEIKNIVVSNIMNESSKKEEVRPVSKVESNIIETETKKLINLELNGDVITLDLESYVIGVVGAEMPASFNVEALKAQSVAARTYALKRINEGKTLKANETNQTYNTNEELQAKWGSDYEKYYNKIKSAVLETEGLVITYDGKLIDAVFHSTSNGMTEDASFVWGYGFPYLKSVSSYDEGTTPFLRTTTISYEDVSNKLGITLTKDSVIDIIEKTPSGRVNKIQIDDQIISGKVLREKLGLRSTDFTIIQNEENIEITTKGYGHGVGMSQYGAGNMAKNGHNYRSILKHFYQNTSVVKI